MGVEVFQAGKANPPGVAFSAKCAALGFSRSARLDRASPKPAEESANADGCLQPAKFAA